MGNSKLSLALSFATAVTLAACSNGETAATGAATSATTTSTSTSTQLSLTASTAITGWGGTVTLTASGGTSPYYLFIQSGGGTMNSSAATYTAPSQDGTVELGVEDQTGATSYVSIEISSTYSVGSSTTLELTSTSIGTNSSYALSATGGVSPYTYQVISALSGSYISGAYFYAGATIGSAVIEVTDADGDTAEATITVISGSSTSTLGFSPSTLSVAAGAAFGIAASGGTPPYTYSIITDNSGSALYDGSYYVAGSVSGTDTIQVTDSAGNVAYGYITVTASGSASSSYCPSDMTYVASGNFCIDTNTGGGYGSGNTANYYWANEICADNNPYSAAVTALDQGKHLCSASEFSTACNSGVINSYTSLWLAGATVSMSSNYGIYSGSSCSSTGSSYQASSALLNFRCCK